MQIANSTLDGRSWSVRTGAGRDSVTFSRARVVSEFFDVNLGSSDSADGNNPLTIVASTFTGQSFPVGFFGGGGKNDRLIRSGNTFELSPSLLQWELIV